MVFCSVFTFPLSQGSEGVDIKEGSYGNIVYNNEIRGLVDTETGGEPHTYKYVLYRETWYTLVCILLFILSYMTVHLQCVLHFLFAQKKKLVWTSLCVWVCVFCFYSVFFLLFVCMCLVSFVFCEKKLGVSLRGDENIVFSNTIIEGEGACVRVGGHEYDDTDFGKNNEVQKQKTKNEKHAVTNY